MDDMTTDTQTIEGTDAMNEAFRRLTANIDHPAVPPELEHEPAPPDDDPPAGGGDDGDDSERLILRFFQADDSAPMAVFSVCCWNLDVAFPPGHAHYRCHCERDGREWYVFVPAGRVKALSVAGQP